MIYLSDLNRRAEAGTPVNTSRPQGHTRRVREFLALLDSITASGTSAFDGAPNSEMLEPDCDKVIQAAKTVRLTWTDFCALDTRPGVYAGGGGYPPSFWKLRQTRNRCGRKFFDALVRK